MIICTRFKLTIVRKKIWVYKETKIFSEVGLTNAMLLREQFDLAVKFLMFGKLITCK